MPRYSYKAIDHKKKTVKGIVSAENAYAARKSLRAKGVHPTDIKEVAGGENSEKSMMSMFSRQNKTQVAEFTKQLATMLRAGIKLTEALTVLNKQVSDAKFKHALTDIIDKLLTGESFADTLYEYPNYFDVIYISMVRVGEVTGTLEQTLTTISDFMEKRRRVESKMKTAMIYPCILLTVCFGAVMFLTIAVIPKVAEQIRETGEELPDRKSVV